jgi:signal transduction histidine kinase
MEPTRRSVAVYGVLAAVWLLVGGWQVHEHLRVREAARTGLRNRSIDIANTLSAFIRGMRFRGSVLQDRLDPVLDEMVASTNDLVKASELISIVLLNASNEPVASAGRPVDLNEADIVQAGERWGHTTLTIVNPVDLGAALTGEGGTNPTVVLPPMQALSGTNRNAGPQPGPPPGEPGFTGFPGPLAPAPGAPPAGFGGGPGPSPRTNVAKAPNNMRRPDWDGRSRRPPWMRHLSEAEFNSLMQKRALHGLVLVLSTDTLRANMVQDLWLRALIIGLASISVVGVGLAWRSVIKTSDLQIRLVRASELNSHLKEMNLAAAGLAHETRNPLNIIRGLAQMIARQPEGGTDIRDRSKDILMEVDKVAAQLNEFINYSRPREVRPTVLSLNSVVGEVTRALNYDLEEKSIHLQTTGDQVSVLADEQLLRQALFNLILNAVQAVPAGGKIEVAMRRQGSSEAVLEVRDDGPGVPPEKRTEIFKPYVTTQKSGTGLGLAVCQQIVLAHGWEIECLANEPRGAVFRISHLKMPA